MWGNSPTEQNDNGVALGRNEPKHEHIFAATVVAFGGGLAQRALGVENDLLVFRAHKMVDNVRRGGVSTRVAKPL